MTIIDEIKTDKELIAVMLELFKGFENNANAALNNPKATIEQLQFVLNVIAVRSHNIQRTAQAAQDSAEGGES